MKDLDIHRKSNFFDELDQQWNKLVNNFFEPTHITSLKNKLRNSSSYPKWDVYTVDDKFVIEASVPGTKLEDISVKIVESDSHRFVVVSGKMSEEYESNGARWSVKELKRSNFSRYELLPEEVEGDPEASMKDGILKLIWNLPKTKPKIPTNVRQITVKKT